MSNLTRMQENVLIDLLIHGDDGSSNITGPGRLDQHHRNAVTTALTQTLDPEGYVRHKGNGIYALTGKGKRKARALARARLASYQDG